MSEFNLSEVQSENTGWKALLPGVNVNAVLETVELSVDANKTVTGDLVFTFKGTTPGNTGNFNFRIFKNNFNKADEKYNDESAKRNLANIKHIMAAYLPDTIVSKVGGNTIEEFFGNVIKVLNKQVIARPCKLKVTLNNTNKLQFPMFPDFITTDLTPDRVLSLNTKINTKTGHPYDRIIPIDVASAPKNDLLGGGFGDQSSQMPNLGDAPLNLGTFDQSENLAF